MYKELNKVFSMIKTELKSEKVELEKVELAVDDYNKFLKELLSIDKDLKNEVGDYVSLKNKIIAIRRNVSKLSFKASGILKETEKLVTEDLKKAKELGVNLPGKALREQAKEWLKDSNKFFNSLKKNL